jgi:DNA-binding MarR family transcriptional regulator
VQDTPSSDVAAEIVATMEQLVRRLRRLSADETAHLSVTPAQARAIRVLGHNGGPIRVKDLALQLGILPRSATSVLDALEAAGLVERRPDRRDRRGVIVDLTADGQAMASLLTTQANSSLTRRIHDELTLEEQADLHDVLHRLARDWPRPDHVGTDRRRPLPFGLQ